MYFLDELKDMKIYRRQVVLPIDERNKKRGSLAFILSPKQVDGLEDILKNNMVIPRYFRSYYTERSVLYYINQENGFEEFDEDKFTVVTEGELYDEVKPKVTYSGAIDIKEIKENLNPKFFKKAFGLFGEDCPDKIKVKSEDNWDYNNSFYVSILPEKYYAESHFFDYKSYCEFAGWNWTIRQMFPGMNDSLAYSVAFVESGVMEKYIADKKKLLGWPFVRELRNSAVFLYEYKLKKGQDAYIEFVKSNTNKLSGNFTANFKADVTLYYVDRNTTPLYDFDESSVAIAHNVGIILEDKVFNTSLKRILYKDRLKSNKQLMTFYDKVKSRCPQIKLTFNTIAKYKKNNLFVDLGSYSEAYLKNSRFSKKRGYKAYTELLARLMRDSRYNENGYNKQTIIIPLETWKREMDDEKTMHLINSSINPFSCIYYALLNKDTETLTSIFGNRDVMFLGEKSYFKINFSRKMDIKKDLTTDTSNKKIDEAAVKANMFLRLIRIVMSNTFVEDEAITTDNTGNKKETSSPKAIKMNLIDKIETITKSNIPNLTANATVSADTKIKATRGSTEEEKKAEIVKTIEKNITTSKDEEEALDSIDNNAEDSEKLKELISDLQTNPDNGSNISGARASRMLKLEKDFLDSEFEGKKIKDIVNTDADDVPAPEPMSLEIDSINPEWKNLTFAKTLESYDMDSDIVKIFQSFANKSNPLVVRELHKEDTSTSGNLIETYTCKFESARGERFTIKVDIPKFVDNKYMVLRGNRKNIPIQLFLMPIIKTDEDAVQIVSCYKKIFIRRFGSTGKSNVATDKLLKTLNKGTFKSIKLMPGENTKICSKYEVPIDYIDIAANYSRIETPKNVYIFDQDMLRNEIKVDDKIGLCIGYTKPKKEPIYFIPNPKEPIFLSYDLAFRISADLEGKEKEDFNTTFEKATTSVRYTYSRASVLDTKIPLVVVCGLGFGLEKTMQKARIKYSFHDKKPKYDPVTQDVIKFKDAYLLYDSTYSSSLLMNGLKQCNTEDYSMKMVNSRLMYLDFLEMFGGRIKADGLDNFADCMVDPITSEVLKHYKLPTDYLDVLLYGNSLLADNKFVKHTDIRTTRRLRKKEQIAHILYEVLSGAYGAYSTGLKHGKNIGFSIKQSSVIDHVLVLNTTEDQSILNAVGEYESYFAVSPKGPTGMNEERSYSLDKRSFDDSMLNVLSTSTGFAGNVGITRQATINPDIQGTRGYIYNDTDKEITELNSVKTLCMTEALTPFGTTRDDPMRVAMGFGQTSKHGMRCEKSDPLLITSGADEALPHLISNTFAYKSKDDGVIKEITDDHMIIEYKNKKDEKGNPEHGYIDLSEEVQKNSSSGFFVTLKLDTDLKVGSKVKAGDIIAYDKKSFSNEMGADDNIAYNIGTLAKYAILNTDEGFEDSAIVSDALSEGMASDIVKAVEITLNKGTNVLSMCKKGQAINEGDTLMVIQNTYDQEDLTTILKNLSINDDSVSELGRKTIKSEVTGWVQDIKIERTVELSDLSPSLRKIVKSYEDEINNRKLTLKKYGIKDENKVLQDTKALPAIGSLKNAADGLKITLYLKYHDKFSTGDKLIYGTAVKGVCKDIFPKGLEPFSEYRKKEKIHALLSIGSINARMVTSVLITTGINKFLIELSRKCKEMAGISYDDNLI